MKRSKDECTKQVPTEIVNKLVDVDIIMMDQLRYIPKYDPIEDDNSRKVSNSSKDLARALGIPQFISRLK